MGRHAVLLLLYLPLVGCTHPYVRPVMDPAEKVFDGIGDSLAKSENKTVDVILVHGMCNQDESWAVDANENLAAALGLRRDLTYGEKSGFEQEPLTDGAILFEGKLIGTPGTVRTYAFLWSPISVPSKRKLCYDISKTTEDTHICAEQDPRFGQIRASFNAVGKDWLMDSCLSDAIYYVGPDGGSKIREATKRALQIAMSGGGPQGRVASSDLAGLRTQTAPLFLISQSLGSKVFFDSFYELTVQANETARENLALRSLANGTGVHASEPDTYSGSRARDEGPRHPGRPGPPIRGAAINGGGDCRVCSAP